jgi:hypothetical protein
MRENFSAQRKMGDQDQAKDTGMALVLICLVMAYLGSRQKGCILLALFLLIIDMVRPEVFRYPAKIWFGLSRLVGAVMSKILLTVLFFGLVTPIGAFRRWNGSDPMQRNKWKKGGGSLFKTRDHTYKADDLKQVY